MDGVVVAKETHQGRGRGLKGRFVVVVGGGGVVDGGVVVGVVVVAAVEASSSAFVSVESSPLFFTIFQW